MKRVIIAWALLTVAVGARGQTSPPTNIPTAEAESLVRLVLAHESIQLSSRYCQIKLLEVDGKAFVADFYSFSVDCDFPRTKATNVLGLYVVSPRTGDVWDYNACQVFKFSKLRRAQESIVRRTHASKEAEKRYQERAGCAHRR